MPRSFAAGSSKAGTGARDVQIGSGPRLRADPARLLRLSVAGLLAVSYLQYFYLDALLQVYSIHSLIVFILVNGHIA